MRRIRVAHVITRLCRGGAQENTFHTVRLANRDRYEVDLISGFSEGSEGSIEHAIQKAGIEIIREPALVRRGSSRHDILALRRLIKLFRKRRYDIVHTHTSKAGFIGRIAAEWTGVPIRIHTPHGNIFHGYFRTSVTKMFIFLERYAAQRTHRLIALTERGIAEHLRRGIGHRGQWTAIFSGIDLTPYDEAIRRRDETRRDLGIAPGDVLIGGVGRLEPVKGFPYFVGAAHRVVEAVPQARFILAGSGSQSGHIRELARPIAERFQMLGLREDVPNLMAAMDVFVLPSLNEGMGRVLLESGAAGTPAVATDVGGVPDVLDDGETGVLVPPGDEEALARVVIDLAADPERRHTLGANARAKVVPAYGIERMVERIEALYEELIGQHGFQR